MAKLIIENLTPEQAKVFASWHEGQGEQDAGVWFEDRNVETPLTDVSRKDGWKIVHPNGDVTIWVK